MSAMYRCPDSSAIKAGRSYVIFPASPLQRAALVVELKNFSVRALIDGMKLGNRARDYPTSNILQWGIANLSESLSVAQGRQQCFAGRSNLFVNEIGPHNL